MLILTQFLVFGQVFWRSDDQYQPHTDEEYANHDPAGLQRAKKNVRQRVRAKAKRISEGGESADNVAGGDDARAEIRSEGSWTAVPKGNEDAGRGECHQPDPQKNHDNLNETNVAPAVQAKEVWAQTDEHDQETQQ